MSINMIESELKNSLEVLLKPIVHATETKHSKLFVSSLSIVKKFVTYNLIKQNQTGSIIQILKDILDNTNEEFIQIKVLETLLPMVNPQTIHLTETLVNNVLIMCLKIFTFKNVVFKNPVSALFKQLMITTFGFLDSFLRPVIEKKIKLIEDQIKLKKEIKMTKIIIVEEEINSYEDLNEIKSNVVDISIKDGPEISEKIKPSDIDLSEFTSFEIFQTSLVVFKNLILIAEGKKKEWIASTTFSKCLAIELLAGIICQSGNLFKYLPEFTELIKSDLYKIIKKNFEITNDYIMGLKLSRISIQIVENLNICYDLIYHLLKYAESQALSWQKLIGLECLSSLCQNNLVLRDLYDKKQSQIESERLNLYDDILNTLTRVSYSAVNNKALDSTKKKEEKKNDLVKYQKIIEVASIINETDLAIPSVTISQLIKLITECYSNFKDSLVIILEINGFKMGQINRDFNSEQLLAKDMLNYNYELIKNAMTALLINSADDTTTQTYLILFQNFINIYGSISLPLARDSYLNDLCKLAIPNNLENSLELKEKNLLIAKALFNIAHCVNILDYNSWILLVDTMQRIYLMLINSNNHMIKPSEEFEIDVIIKNLENNIKKYKPDYGQDEKSVLKNQQTDDHKTVQDAEKETVNYEESLSIRDNTNTLRGEREKTNDPEKKKGIFSMMKSALGFSKTHSKTESIINNNLTSVTSAITNTNHSKKISNTHITEENTDLHILSNAIDTIFISSTAYDDNTIKDISRALLDSCKNLIETPQSSSDNSITYLHFNLTKLLEISVINVKRIHVFWDVIISMVTYICSKNLTNISRFSLDVLTIINLFIIIKYKPFNEKQLQVSNISWNFENWQKTIFSPFSKISLQNISQNINLNIIYNLSKILQNCGQNLSVSGWSSFIEVCEVLINKSDENLCDNTFKLIEQIINEYLDYLNPYNTLSLIDILEMFALYKKNHNISYSAITMFWSASTVAEKFQKISNLDNESLKSNKTFNLMTNFQREFYTHMYPETKKREEFFDNIWKEFFLKLVNISSDNRFDVRKSAINIFADIFVAKNGLISNSVSLIIINKYFLGVLEKSYSIFEEKLKLNRSKKNATMDQGNQLKTPKFSDNIGDMKIGEFKIDQLKLPEKKLKFDEETVNKFMQPTADEKEWEDTSILIIQALGKITKSFLTLNYQKEKELEYYKENLLTLIIGFYSKIMKMTTPELASSILKSTMEIYYSNLELFLNSFDLIWKIFEEMGRFITTDFFLSQLCTIVSSSRMVYNVLEILKEIFLKESNILNKPEILQNENFENLLIFISSLIKSSKNSEGIQSITNPQRLLGDEKLIFDFIDKIARILNDSNSWKIYCTFLSSFLQFDINDNHTESHLRKSLELFELFFTGANPYIDITFIKEYLPKLIREIRDIACLRNKNEFLSLLIKNNKSQMQVWHFSVFQLIKILNSILCGNRQKEEYSSVYSNYLSNYNTVIHELDIPEIDYDNYMNVNNIWEATINCLETIFRQSEGGYKTINRAFIEELLKSCQEMEIQIINFIVNGLLPNSLKIPKEMQIKLLYLLDMGSNFDYNIFNIGSQSITNSSNISRVCISNLFELCKFRNEDSLRKEVTTNADDYVKIKIKIAKMSTPILIKRCKETLKKFLDDEIKSGAMPLPRSRLEDIKYVLEKLKNLEIYSNYLYFDDESFTGSLSIESIQVMDIVIKNKKSHLFQLLPLLSDFITTKENDIKLIIKEIFKIISNEIGVK